MLIVKCYLKLFKIKALYYIMPFKHFEITFNHCRVIFTDIDFLKLPVSASEGLNILSRLGTDTVHTAKRISSKLLINKIADDIG